MATRIVRTIVSKGDDSPWKYAKVEFKLSNDSFTDTRHYPVSASHITAIANESGEISASLWVNTEGDKPTAWICSLPSGEEYKFNIPAGDTPIQLSALRSDYQPGNPQYQSVLTYVDSYIDTLVIPGNEQYQLLAIAPGQNTFSLNLIPTQPQKSRLYWNGVKQLFGVDFNINSLILTTNISLLSPTDLLEIYYL